MRRGAVLTGVLVWVLVVAVASGVTWAVIDGAGQSLLAGEDTVAETQPAPTPATLETGVPSQPAAKPSRHRRSRDASSGAAVAPAASPSPTPARPATTPARPRRTTGPAPAPGSGSGAGTGAGSVERTWEGPPGLVTVRCDGSRTTLLSATPSNGYRVEVDRGTERIEVHFESASREYKVVARCSGGEPRFAVEGGGEDEADD